MWVLLVCLITLSSSAILDTNTSSSSQLFTSATTSTATTSSELPGFTATPAFIAVLLIPAELLGLLLLVSSIVACWSEYVRATTLAPAQAMVVANNTLQQPAMRAMQTLQIQNPASTRPSLDITLADAGSVSSLNSEMFPTYSEPHASTPRQEHLTNLPGA